VRPRFSILVRKRWPSVARTVLISDPGNWTPHLKKAWETLLCTPLPAEQARLLMGYCITAAYDCAVAINNRSQSVDERRRSSELKSALGRISNCIRRAPASLRHELDEEVSALLRSGDADSEVIETIFRHSRAVFERFPELEPARTALSALRVYRDCGFDAIGLVSDFESLGPLVQEACRLALVRVIKSESTIDAATFFMVLADAIPKPDRELAGAVDLIITYVVAVAEAWHDIGLQPRRGPKFRKFCDLVLAALIEPETSRHDEKLEERSKRAWERQKQLPPEERKWIRGGLRRTDSQWLVTAHCLREGLKAARSKNPVPDSKGT
jgi:hypothetical protein